MMCFSPIRWSWCLLIMLGILFSSAGGQRVGVVASHQMMAVGEEFLEEIEEESFSEEEITLLAVVPLFAEERFVLFSDAHRFRFMAESRPTNHPSGWLMPLRA